MKKVSLTGNMGQAICCFQVPVEEDLQSAFPNSPSLTNPFLTSSFLTNSLSLSNYNSEDFELQLQTIQSLDIPLAEHCQEYYITVEIFLHSALVQVKRRLYEWAEQLFTTGWNVQIIRIKSSINSSSYGVKYQVTLSNRYLIPIHHEDTLIYRGRPYIEKWCVICQEQFSNRIVLPCGHLCLCDICVLKYSQIPKLNPPNTCPTLACICPNCRADIDQIEDAHKVGFRWVTEGSSSSFDS